MDNCTNDTIKKTTNENQKSPKKRGVMITADLLFNVMNEKGLSKDNNVNIKNFPSGTTENDLGKVEELLKNKPDTLIVHAGINDFTKGKNVLNTVKKNY